MRLPRPKSLSGLMLIGFTIVAAPLLFAIVNAAVQMNRLSNRSEQLVVHGIQGTRNNQSMFEEIGALERTARLYQIIGNSELRDVYTRNHDRLAATIEEMLTLPLDSQLQDDARALLREADRLSTELGTAPPNSPRMAEIINSFPHLSEMASGVSNRISAHIDRELTSLQLAAEHAQQQLLWQTLPAGSHDAGGRRRFHLFVRPPHPRNRSSDQRTGARYFLAADRHQRPPPTSSASPRNWNG